MKDAGYGCHMNGTFMGGLSYADDITLISPSIRGLDKMLSICAEFVQNLCRIIVILSIVLSLCQLSLDTNK